MYISGILGNPRAVCLLPMLPLHPIMLHSEKYGFGVTHAEKDFREIKEE